MSNKEENDDTKGDHVESEIKIVHNEVDYKLDTVNGYGDNLLHLSAANDCHVVIEEIFKIHGCKNINPKNDCGWTPLMQAIRNGNIETVKLLLENGCRPTISSSTSEDVSAIGLAAAMGLTMFEIVYNACPSALEDAKHDSINPLCVAAMKGDKELFFRLLELGLKVSEANEYTHLMMKQSRIPEIAKLAEIRNDFDDTWNESIDHFDFPDDEFETPQMSSTLDNIESSLSAELSNENNNSSSQNSELPSIRIIPPNDKANVCSMRKNSQHPKVVNSLPRIDEVSSYGFISPRLPYTRRQNFPISPSMCLAKKNINNDDSGFLTQDNIDNDKQKMHKYKLNRPPDLEIYEDHARGSEYALEKLHDIDPSVLCGVKTPIEPPYATPPPGMILDSDQTKIAVLLKRFGLTHMIYIFLEQEVDLDLFLTLSDQDLQEIGIKRKSDRNVVLSVIAECNRYKM